MADVFWSTTIPRLLPYFKLILWIVIACILIAVFFLIIVNMRRRKWFYNIWEQKSDGELHLVARDVNLEKKVKFGTKCVYWLKNAKVETIPPNSACVVRHRGKDYVDCLRVERTYIPGRLQPVEGGVDYQKMEVRDKVETAYDRIRDDIKNVGTTYFSAKKVDEKYIYIPIKRSLHVPMKYKIMDFDMYMMAVNEIHNADEFYQAKWEFWKKYGAIIVFALTIIFLIILVVLTFQYMNDIVAKMMSEIQSTGNMLSSIGDKMGFGKPPG